MSVEHIDAVDLGVLSVGRTKNKRHIMGCSHNVAFKAIDAFVNAVYNALEMDIFMLQSTNDLK